MALSSRAQPAVQFAQTLGVCAAVLWQGHAAADATSSPTPRASEEAQDAGAPKPVAMGAALIPGVVVHGAGTWVGGDHDTGERLLAMEGVGLGLILAGGLPIGLTGASRYLVAPAASTVILGVGLFTVSWVADLYAVTAPEGGFGSPRTRQPWIETELGYRYVYDPRFDYRHFMVQRIDYRTGRLRMTPTAWWSTGTNNARLRLLAGYRVFGVNLAPDARGAKPSGSLDIEAAFTRQEDGDNLFTITSGEVFVHSRTDLEQLGKPLEGSFLEMGLGGAIQSFAYEIPGQDIPADWETMLLARFGFGVYVGGPQAPDGELLFYYDHRHDGYAAGLLSTLPTSGVAGHFGLDARFFGTEHWGVSGQAQIGSALVTGLSLVFRDDMK